MTNAEILRDEAEKARRANKLTEYEAKFVWDTIRNADKKALKRLTSAQYDLLRICADKAPKRRAGNTDKPVTQTAIPLKLDNDLVAWLKDYEGEKRNTFINKAVKERIDRLQAMLDESQRLEDLDDDSIL
ncbi:hypothetical protein [Spirosoma sp. 209]|uniref:hypothetical protein n=1 Tax=Spirosoma sp. 209 TaxID=1955701 RepID=UPI00098D2CA2|nr:hypothetical protein [Spirosoma sp. 209]